MRFTAIAVVGLSICLTSSAGCSPKTARLEMPFPKARQEYPTVLTRREPAPEQWSRAMADPPGTDRFFYTSGDLRLRAWSGKPKLHEGKLPAIVFLHDGFVFLPDDWKSCQIFLDAGFFVMCPTYRGENGNPGHFEMFWGEVDDIRAAVKYLAEKESRVDPERIYVFGHGTGGNLAALVSMYDDQEIQLTASCGGLYPYTIFSKWRQHLPFDGRNPRERQLRTLAGNTEWLKHPHFAYMGDQDELIESIPTFQAEVAETKAPVTITTLAGDHEMSLKVAMRAFVKEITDYEKKKGR